MGLKKHNAGFTLAELLISLVILGLIAAFTIPKILQNQADKRRYSVIKETVAAISEITYYGWQAGEIKANTNGLYILDRMNVIKLCRTDAVAEGCWDAAMGDPSGGSETSQPGAILPNGAMVAGLDDFSSADFNSLVLDWNGPAPPNTFAVGGDQMRLRICYGNSEATCAGVKPGTIGPYPTGTARAMYYEVFAN